MMKMKKPELLSPAGDWEKLQMAVLYGADAVYLAGTSFGMRSFAGNFDDEQLPRAVQFAHDHGVKVHATVNTMPRWGEADQLPAYLEQLERQKHPKEEEAPQGLDAEAKPRKHLPPLLVSLADRKPVRLHVGVRES